MKNQGLRSKQAGTYSFFSTRNLKVKWVFIFAMTLISLSMHSPAQAVDVPREKIVTDAQNWLTLVPFPATHASDLPPATDERPLLRQAGEEYLALLSYPQAQGKLARTAFLYDNALALLWYSWTGDQKSARGIVNTLTLLQNPDGSWGFSFTVEEKSDYNFGFVRNGSVSWAAYALADYVNTYGDRTPLPTIHKALNYLQEQTVTEVKSANWNLVKGGRGFRTGPEFKNYIPDGEFAVSPTEHQFDAFLAQSLFRKPQAQRLARRIVNALWIDQEGRFALAVDSKKRDDQRALDAAGAWGSLFLLSVGQQEMAQRSFNYTLTNFPSKDRRYWGMRPYLDPIDGRQSAMNQRLIFVEGTLSLGLAAHRLGRSDIAFISLKTAESLAQKNGPGVPYSNINAVSFPTYASAAPTLWYLFLEREIRTGKQSPLFPKQEDFSF